MSKRKQARIAIRNGDFTTAAHTFEAMVTDDPDDIDLYLQVARCYQQAGDREQAADWYLRTARLYVDMGVGVQAVALLRIYRDLRPDDVETCRALFRQCRTETSEPTELLGMLSENDQACYTMRYGEIFSALDDASFDALLDDMRVRELHNGDVLVRTGEAAESLFLIAEGAVQAWMIKNGQRVSLGKIGAGGVCGEVPLFIGSRKRTGDLIACCDTRVVEIHYALLKEMAQKSADISQRIDALYHRHLLERQIALNPFFASLPAAVRQQIAADMIVVRAREGSIIYHQGDQSLDLYLVRSGELGVSLDPQGEEGTMLKIIRGGGIMGEATIAADGERLVTVKALSDVVLLRWSGQAYQACYQTLPHLQTLAAARLEELKQQIAQFHAANDYTTNEEACNSAELMAALMVPRQQAEH